MSRRRVTPRAEPAQLRLPLDPAPRDAVELLVRLRGLGLSAIERCRLTVNRSVMVSVRGSELRVHRGFLDAPEDVLRAIAAFAAARRPAARRDARAVILAYPVRVDTLGGAASRRPLPRPGDERLVAELSRWHRAYNARHFGGALRDIPIRVSGRMRIRLGQYTMPDAAAERGEIAVSRRHIRRHGWGEALHTLLHEMVHQWQAERGLPVDHGPAFRRKARELGIEPRARRGVDGIARIGDPDGVRALAPDDRPLLPFRT